MGLRQCRRARSGFRPGMHTIRISSRDEVIPEHTGMDSRHRRPHQGTSLPTPPQQEKILLCGERARSSVSLRGIGLVGIRFAMFVQSRRESGMSTLKSGVRICDRVASSERTKRRGLIRTCRTYTDRAGVPLPSVRASGQRARYRSTSPGPGTKENPCCRRLQGIRLV
jgi:hypothetical protein